MQIGRWNHQSTGGNSNGGQGGRSHPARPERRGGGRSPYRSGGRDRGGYGSSSRSWSSSRPGNGGRSSYSSRVGSRPSRKRSGFGAFGETEAEISKFISKAEELQEEAPFTPAHRFADFAVDDRLKANIEAKGYDLPTPIQDSAIQPILDGHDVVGLAETGTGKTAAFLVPLIHKVVTHPDERVLVMAPTRELAVQIEKELAGFAKGLGFRGMIAVGGTNINPQISQLRYHPSFVIGTPGRLKDLMERGSLDLSGFGTVVLDEADRMLDMGFIDDMRFILGKMRPKRHTLFFSATMSKEIENLVGDFLSEPIVISVKKQDTSKNIDQDVVRVGRGDDKFERLVELLSDSEYSKTLVFGRTKYGVEKLAKMLSRRGIKAESIHGNKTHNARVRSLEAFKKGKVGVLVATDVAARGLDIPAVSHVINYDLPSTYEDYVHRIGRTGRAAAKGKALTFVQG